MRLIISNFTNPAPDRHKKINAFIFRFATHNMDNLKVCRFYNYSNFFTCLTNSSLHYRLARLYMARNNAVIAVFIACIEATQ